MTRNVTQIQQWLIAQGFPVGPDGADGKFGQDTLDAYNRQRASRGLAPVAPAQFTLVQVNADLWPDEQPPLVQTTSNPFDNPLVKIGLELILPTILKGLPLVNILSGYKTYIVAIVSILVGASDWAGIAIPGTTTSAPAVYILGGLVALFGRSALAGIVEDIVGKIGGVDPSTIGK